MENLKKGVVVGDIHGRWKQFYPQYLEMREEVGDIDFMIAVGDTGFWPRLYQAPEFKLDHPVFWIDGNHEDHEVLAKRDEPFLGFSDPYHRPLDLQPWIEFMQDWRYIPRGTIFGGCLFIGGAKSINAQFLRRGVNWFPEENLSRADVERTLDNIEAYGKGRIHTVFTHDCPSSFDVREACTLTGGEVIDDGNRKFLQTVLQDVCPVKWFFGHYHKPMSYTCRTTGCEWRCVDMTRPSSLDYVVLELPFSEEEWDDAVSGKLSTVPA